jgi:hypothetical protein
MENPYYIDIEIDYLYEIETRKNIFSVHLIIVHF